MGILGQHQKNVPIECLDVFNEELALSGKYLNSKELIHLNMYYF